MKVKCLAEDHDAMIPGGEVTCSIHDGRVKCIFLGCKFTASVFFGSRDLPRIFLGLKVCLIE